MPSDLAAFLWFVPPWLILGSLVGVINGAACFMLLGRRATHLAWYAVLGALAAGVGQVFGTAIQAPAPVSIGELNVLVASASTWALLLAARAAGL